MAENDKTRSEAAREKYEHAVTRLSDDLDRLIKMAGWMREALENELFTGMGYKQLGVASTDIKRMAELTKTYEIIVDTKVKYDKAAKLLAESMSPAEERSAVIAYLKAADRETRAYVLTTMRAWSDDRHGS